MVERIMISFEMDKNDLLNLFEEEFVSKGLEDFLKKYFSCYLEMHKQNIRNNMKAIGLKMEEKEIEEIVFKYLKSCIEEQDMEILQIEVAKVFFEESFTNRKEPKIAIYKVFDRPEIIAIAEKIWKKIRNKYLVSTI